LRYCSNETHTTLGPSHLIHRLIVYLLLSSTHLSLLLLFVNQSRQRVSINYNELSTTHTPSHYTRSFQSTSRTTPSQLRPLLYKRNYLSTTANKTFEMLANGLTFLTALLPLLSVADAAHAAPKHHRRHHALASRDEPSPRGIAQVAPRANAGHAEAKRTIKRAVKKRGAQQQCRVRESTPPTPSSAAASAVSSVAAESAAPSPAASSSAAAAETPSIPNQNAWADQVCLTSTVLHQLTVQSAQSSSAAAPSPPAPSPSAWSEPAPAPAPSSNGGLLGGIISLTDGYVQYSNSVEQHADQQYLRRQQSFRRRTERCRGLAQLWSLQRRMVSPSPWSRPARYPNPERRRCLRSMCSILLGL